MTLRAALLAAVVVSFAAAGAARASTALSGPVQDFVLNCAGCHKFDGSGSDRVPGLHQVGRVLAVPGGRQYLARIPGVAQAPLSDARLAALLNWLLAEFGAAAPSPPYSAAEVGALRAAPLRDPIAARAALLPATPP